MQPMSSHQQRLSTIKAGLEGIRRFGEIFPSDNYVALATMSNALHSIFKNDTPDKQWTMIRRVASIRQHVHQQKNRASSPAMRALVHFSAVLSATLEHLMIKLDGSGAFDEQVEYVRRLCELKEREKINERYIERLQTEIAENGKTVSTMTNAQLSVTKKLQLEVSVLKQQIKRLKIRLDKSRDKSQSSSGKPVAASATVHISKSSQPIVLPQNGNDDEPELKPEIADLECEADECDPFVGEDDPTIREKNKKRTWSMIDPMDDDDFIDDEPFVDDTAKDEDFVLSDDETTTKKKRKKRKRSSDEAPKGPSIYTMKGYGLDVPAECPICQLPFPTYGSLSAHLDRKHENSGRFFGCAGCNEAFSTYTGLMLHMLARKDKSTNCKGMVLSAEEGAKFPSKRRVRNLGPRKRTKKKRKVILDTSDEEEEDEEMDTRDNSQVTVDEDEMEQDTLDNQNEEDAVDTVDKEGEESTINSQKVTEEAEQSRKIGDEVIAVLFGNTDNNNGDKKEALEDDYEVEL